MKKTTLCLAILSAVMSSLLIGCASPREQATLYDLGPVSATADAAGSPAHGTLMTNAMGAPAASGVIGVTNAGAALAPIGIAEPIAPSALDSQRMLFRLAYANDQQPRAYAGSRWTMPPAQLFVQRLKTHLARSGASVVSASTGANVPLLRIEADDFTQVFASPTQSSAHVMLRAAVLHGRVLVAQKTFNRQMPAPTPDAAGGARALAAASDAIIADMTVWLAGLPLKRP